MSDAAWEALRAAVDAAEARLAARREYKEAARFLAAPPADPEDRERQAGALRDLLDLAAAEVAEAARRDAEERRSRERHDRALLVQLDAAGRLGLGLSGLAFVLPPLALGPFGPWCALGGLPALAAIARILGARRPLAGRLWVIPRHDADEASRRAVTALAVAGVATIMAGVWAVVAALRASMGAA